MTTATKQRLARTLVEVPSLTHSDYSMQSAAMHSAERLTEIATAKRHNAMVKGCTVAELRQGLKRTRNELPAID